MSQRKAKEKELHTPLISHCLFLNGFAPNSQQSPATTKLLLRTIMECTLHVASLQPAALMTLKHSEKCNGYIQSGITGAMETLKISQLKSYVLHCNKNAMLTISMF